ncbi:MAG: Rap1a/Tai family immunity protein [Marinomonas sp.]
MKIFLVSCAIFWAVLTPSPAKADFVDGNELLAKCSTPKGDTLFYMHQSYCIAYVVGSVDALTSAQTIDGFPTIICVPENVSSNQLKDIVLLYLEKHPEDRHLGGSTIVMVAVAKAFPCGVNQ